MTNIAIGHHCIALLSHSSENGPLCGGAVVVGGGVAVVVAVDVVAAVVVVGKFSVSKSSLVAIVPACGEKFCGFCHTLWLQ